MTGVAPLVEVDDVTKVYTPSPPLMRLLLRSAIDAPVRALDGVSLSVNPGQICAVVGPNGAGKSTLFRILTGLTTPTSGRASICGFDVTRQALQVRSLIGFHPADDRTVLGRHTCRENLYFHGRLQGWPKAELTDRIREVLDLVGLAHASNRVAIALSSGMRARLQLARALLHRPRVLILDEPTGTLDPVAAYELMEIIKQEVEENSLAALVSSHRLEEIESLHDHVVLLDRGAVVYQGDLDSLRLKWEKPRLRVQFGSLEACEAAAGFLATLEALEVVDVDDNAILIHTELPVGSLFALSNGQLDGAEAIARVRMPVRELLASILGEPARIGDRDDKDRRRRRLRSTGGDDPRSDEKRMPDDSGTSLW